MSTFELQLIQAAKDGDIPRVQELLLLKERVNINVKDNKYGWTPLRWACGRGHLKVVKLLIENGADVNIKYHSRGRRWTLVFQWACQNGHWEILNKLLLLINNNGANNHDINAKSGKAGATQLHWACEKGYLEVAKLLIENGADVNIQNIYGSTPLLSACSQGHLEMVKLLIENGADIHAKCDGYLWTLLHFASFHNHLEIATLLMENDGGANDLLESKDTICGQTPFHLACSKGHLDMVQLLLSRGANPTAKTTQGSTPLHVACSEHHTEVVFWLVRQNPWLAVDLSNYNN